MTGEGFIKHLDIPAKKKDDLMDLIVKNHEEIRDMLNQTVETIDREIDLVSENNKVEVNIKLN